MTRKELMDLDRQFDHDTSVGGVEAWASYFAQDGVMIVGKGIDIIGPSAIRNEMESAFSMPGFNLRWEPIDSDLSVDGTLGYTYGKYVRQIKDPEGNVVESTGKYTTIWKLQPNRQWKITLDIGN